MLHASTLTKGVTGENHCAAREQYLSHIVGLVDLDRNTLKPYLTNGFSHRYHLGESTFIFRGVRSFFYFLSYFSMKFLCANRIAPDGAILFAYVPQKGHQVKDEKGHRCQRITFLSQFIQ